MLSPMVIKDTANGPNSLLVFVPWIKEGKDEHGVHGDILHQPVVVTHRLAGILFPHFLRLIAGTCVHCIR